MSSRTAAATAYFAAFAANDHAKILSLLTDDVVWNIPGGDLISRVESYVVPLSTD